MNIAEKVIKIIFDEVYPISGQSFRQITQLVEYKTIPKNEVFIQRGRTNSSEYFILEGICRSYLVNPDGDDIMISFFQAPAVLSPHITRTKDGLSLLYFQAITDLQVAYFSEKALVELMIENQEIRFFANTVLLDELIRKVEKEIGFASLTAKERLIRFRAVYDGLENKVPHPMIASYLGITNISLSRLRRDLAEGKRN
ncbi:MAG: Crp/Fnr family transcriptional regulator [Phaeodactylibacter sp.]|nr:Crp/Fnr family transcriptional regulator [Phaeodactylibacter sp.]MCB9299370.1 Crp/Fnr family transcriptional regulator [Lewinellaceae bacterium]